MSVDIKTETVDFDGKSALLVTVKDGSCIIGTCSMGCVEQSGNLSARLRMFYIGSDPVLNLICPSRANKQSDKLVSFSPGFQGYDIKINDALTNSFNRLNNGESLGSGLRDVFGLLEDGVYTVYYSDYYPTDGNGNFYWGAYNISHEVHGTAEHNRAIGDREYRPCFLLPTQPMDYFAPRVKVGIDEQVKTRRVQGIAYHVSGLYSALLKGHHGSVFCVENNIPFRCAVIEKITEPYVERKPRSAVSAPPAGEVDPEAPNAAEQLDAEQTPAENPDDGIDNAGINGITGFRSPSVKIPLYAFPRDVLKQLIESRTEFKPPHFNIMAAKLLTTRRKSINNNAMPRSVLERAEQMPDCEMVESAYAIDELTDEQLNCLLRGEVECNGKLIVSPNFYSSIITACSFLQFKDPKRFVDFSIAIMESPELSAAHEYVARRVASQTSNSKVFNFFKTVSESNDVKYDKIHFIAQTYVRRLSQK